MAILRRLFGRRTEIPEAPPPIPQPTISPVDAQPRPATPEANPADPMSAQRLVRRTTISRPQPRSGRIKTRLMNYGQLDAVLDELEMENGNSNRPISRPVGWLVIIEGPGTGAWFTLESGMTRIGRGDAQNVCLDFGDTTISRETHVSIAYEPVDHRFRLGQGRSKNEVLVNGSPVEDTIDLTHGDLITVGETTLRLAAFCDDRFAWAPIIDKGNRNAISA